MISANYSWLKHPLITKYGLHLAVDLFSNSQQTFVWLRCLEDIFCLGLQKTSSNHSQDVLIKKNVFALVIYLCKTSWKSPQDVSETPLRRPQDFFKVLTRPQNIFKMSSIQSQDTFKTFSRLLQGVPLKESWSR